MNGKLRHIERRKAAKEKEALRWAEVQREEADIERASVIADTLRSKGVDVVAELLKMGITEVGSNTSEIVAALEEILARVEKG